ncbi:hypothetical protein jhhlp_007143 [Lomentospora prolificans]|uniref:Nitrogen regulatory protein areA GATA-like domain-containing protein n=1 Tax=Lomentospora prolificans TaxID=41688 RepID=A0A2N3N1T9_9PEZI|nr:hypothetical protein jhhlp_007143 [Lomentospora prolificans]
MAVVLSSEDDYFSSTNLRRTRSQSKFATKSSLRSSASTSRLEDSYSHFSRPYSDSTASSPAPSSPRTVQPADSTDGSLVSTPASNISLSSSSDCDELQIDFHPDDHFVLPDYDHALYPDPLEDLEPPPSPKNGHSYTNSPDNDGSGSSTDGPVTPEVVDRAEDDTAIRQQPTRHVDYLSHNWTEEEIWSSWRYIVSRRKDYMNAARLENASWRTWLKAKNNLRTVSPETLNWLKECDVTWLYGPLQTPDISAGRAADPETGSSTMSKSNSFINKKPILKKRSMSEIMLRRSLSSSSLLKQAAAAVQAQEKDARRGYSRPAFDRATTDYVTFPFSSRRESKETSLLPSASSSGIVSPTSGRRRIHFNEQVEQCIAVDLRADDDNDTPVDIYGSSDSDDGAIMMKRTSTRRKRMPVPRRKKKVPEGKTIAMLPSTTLKDREGILDSETAMKHSGRAYRSPTVSPSSSQETLRADAAKSNSPRRSFFEEVDDGDVTFADASSSLDRPGGGLRRTTSSSSLTSEPTGMRRTPSGMFMPCDETEVPAGNGGIFSRVLDTVNTARDIAHVIWNVGWRK